MRKTAMLAGLLSAGIIMLAGNTTVKAEEANTNQENPNQPVMVEIVQGDSLAKIANNNQTTYTRLFDANTYIKDPNLIYPGKQVRIPSADEQLVRREIQTTNMTVSPSSAPINAAPKKTTKSKATNKTIKKSTPATPNAPATGNVWDNLARCESGGNWSINTGNGYYGGLQFTASTWRSVGGSGLPHQASREEQIARGQILQARSGWGQWPACTRKLGLR